MKLAVFGPTGPTGEQVLRRALAAGHEVTAVARRPEAIAVTDQRLRVVAGDVLGTASALRDGVAGADAVLSALGGRARRRPTTVYSAGTAAVLAAMRDTDVDRFVGITAAPVGPDDQNGALDRYVAHPLLHRFFGGDYDDMRRMEDVLAASDRAWTVLRPPRLTGSAFTGRYRTAVDAPLPRARTISRADLAAAMLAAAQDPALIGHAVTIAA
ncbi:MAG TPA: NAD(P)H-binding protein [Pseudonocardiaceae bacterium]